MVYINVVNYAELLSNANINAIIVIVNIKHLTAY